MTFFRYSGEGHVTTFGRHESDGRSGRQVDMSERERKISLMTRMYLYPPLASVSMDPGDLSTQITRGQSACTGSLRRGPATVIRGNMAYLAGISYRWFPASSYYVHFSCLCLSPRTDQHPHKLYGARCSFLQYMFPSTIRKVLLAACNVQRTFCG